MRAALESSFLGTRLYENKTFNYVRMGAGNLLKFGYIGLISSELEKVAIFSGRKENEQIWKHIISPQSSFHYHSKFLKCDY
jgi:hypothetical protein